MARRILIFSLAYYPDPIGGAEIAVKEITDRIKLSDFEFDMVTLRFDRRFPKFEKIGNVNIWRTGMGIKFLLPISKLIFPFTAFFKAIRLNKARQYSIIWSIMANRAGFASLFFKIINPKIKFVLTLQEGDVLDYPEKRMGILKLVLNPLFKQIFLRADTVQAISNFLANWAKDMGVEKDIMVIPNGVDIQKFSKEHPGRDLNILKDNLVKKITDKFLITVSRLVLKNAVSDIVKSLQFLPSNYKLLVLGEGREFNLLKKLSNDIGVGKRVFFLGQISQVELPKYLKISDVFIRPSLSEGMGISFIEAMAAGVPVVATPVGGIVDFLFDPDMNPEKESTGLFCNVKDPKSIAEKVLKLELDNELRKNIITNAKKLVKDKYDWDKIAVEIKNIF